MKHGANLVKAYCHLVEGGGNICVYNKCLQEIIKLMVNGPTSGYTLNGT